MMNLHLTHLDKVYWKKEGITKGDLLAYYEEIAPYLLPHLQSRPLVMHRFPEGIGNEGFFQKEAGPHLPSFVKTVKVTHKERVISYILVENLETLLYVVNLGSIELHPFHSSYKRKATAPYAILDLDPEDIAFDQLVEVARSIHDVLYSEKIESFVKTSGARGLHIYIPLEHRRWAFARHFSEQIAAKVHQKMPDITSLKRKPQERQKKVYIDCLQNHPMQTAVSVYSVRARPGAPVSTPLSWDEVTTGLDPHAFTIKTVPKRLQEVGCLFKGLLRSTSKTSKIR